MSCSQQRDRLRDEVASLQRQLHILHENQELRESLDRLLSNSSNGDLHKWKFRAMRERFRKHDAKQRNVLLRQRLAANAKILEQVSDLIQKPMAKSLSSNHQFARLNDDGALVFSALRACLDSRSSQLHTIIPQCDPTRGIAPSTRVAPTPWTATAVDRGVCVAINEVFAVPFHSTAVCDVLSHLTLLHGLQVLADNRLDKIAQFGEPNWRGFHDQLSGWSEYGRRLILRTIEDARGTVLLWEGSSYWQASEIGAKHEVRDSGWVLIAPAADHSSAVSTVRYGGLVQIRATNQLRLKANDREVTCIVRAVQSNVKSRNLQLENALMDTHLQRQSLL